MFGCVVAGRLLQTGLTQVDETHAYFELANAEAINHVCVFLLGTGEFLGLSWPLKYLSVHEPVPFPDGYGATVHFFWPGKGFQLLGMCVQFFHSIILVLTSPSSRLSNEKPSAIFRLRGTFSIASSSSNASQAFGQSQLSTEGSSATATLGISIEPLGAIATQISGMPSAGPATGPIRPADAVALAERIVKHMMNYMSGFAPPGVRGDTAIPLALFQKWYDSFLGKIKAGGVGFLERSES
jgi:protein Hikeshi